MDNSNNKQTTLAPATLTLDTTTNTKTQNNNAKVPRQVLRLKIVRVQMASQATARTQGVIYLDIPYFSSDSMNDGNSTIGFPICLNDDQTTFYTTDISINMSKEMPNSIRYFLRNADGSLVDSNVQRVTLTFSYDYVYSG